MTDHTRLVAFIIASLAWLVLPALAPSRSRAGTEPWQFRWANPKPQGNGLNAIAFRDDALGYAVGERGATLRTTDGGATWTDLADYPSFTADLQDLLVLPSGDLLAVGESPGIFRSSDGGESWTPVSNPSTDDLFDIEMIAGDTLSAAGDSGAVLRSTDGGASWSLITIPGVFGLHDQFWWNGDEGYVVGFNQARKTTDGGATWSPLSGIDESRPNNLTAITFLDPMNGWILEHFTTYRTTDGGATWFPKHGSISTSPIYQSDLVVIDASHRYVVTDLEGAGIWETFDDGLTWTHLYQRSNTRGYTDLDRRSDGALVTCSSFGDLLRSSDGGATWTNAVGAPDDAERQKITAFAFLPGGRALAGGSGQTWLRSEDGGFRWERDPANPGIETPHAIEFLNDAFGLAGGYVPPGQSKVFRTTDGGDTWTGHELSGSYVGYPQGIAVPDTDTCYVVTSGDTQDYVFKSVDGGVTWALAGLGVGGSSQLASVFFLDGRTGFVGGGEFSSNALIWKTTDGGAAWSMLGESGLGQARIAVMHWWNESTGLAGNYDGLYRTSNGGATWTEVLSEACFSLDFHDDARGVAASYFYPWVWVTSDSGNTWTKVEYPWVGAPECVAAVEGGFYAGGGGNVILHGVSEAAASVADSHGRGSPGPGRASLVRISPNPSAGVITVRFANRLAGLCRLRIVDVRGREVGAIARVLDAGTGVLSWDGSGRSPGVYFLDLRLPAGERRSGRFLLAPAGP